MLDGWKTFILGILAMGLTFYGCRVGAFPATVFTETLWAVMGAFAFKEVGKKFGQGYINKHNKADHDG